MNRLEEARLLLLLCKAFFRIRPRIRQFDCIGGSRRGAPPLRDVCDRAIVRDAEDECPFRTLAAKPGQRLPNRQSDVLKQIVAVARVVRVAGRESTESSPVAREQLVEALFESRSGAHLVR